MKKIIKVTAISTVLIASLATASASYAASDIAGNGSTTTMTEIPEMKGDMQGMMKGDMMAMMQNMSKMMDCCGKMMKGMQGKPDHTSPENEIKTPETQG